MKLSSFDEAVWPVGGLTKVRKRELGTTRVRLSETAEKKAESKTNGGGRDERIRETEVVGVVGVVVVGRRRGRLVRRGAVGPHTRP